MGDRVLVGYGDGSRVGKGDGDSVGVGEEGETEVAIGFGVGCKTLVRAESRAHAASPRFTIKTRKINR